MAVEGEDFARVMERMSEEDLMRATEIVLLHPPAQFPAPPRKRYQPPSLIVFGMRTRLLFLAQ